jgi:uncharacterized membrane protein
MSQDTSNVPVQVVVAAFNDEKAADEALSELKAAKWAGLIGIQDAAVIRKDDKGRLHIKETGDWGGGKGAAAGAVIGGVIGLVTGPGAILVGAAGAVIGGLAAKLRDSGFPNDRLETLGKGLEPGTSAIVAVIEHKWVQDLEREMAEAGADVLTEAIAADIAEQMEAGREVYYTSVSSEDGLAGERIVTGEDQVEASTFVITEEGTTAKRIFVNEDEAVVEEYVETADGIYQTAAVSTDESVAAAGVMTTGEGVVAFFAEESNEEEDDGDDEEGAETDSDADGEEKNRDS